MNLWLGLQGLMLALRRSEGPLRDKQTAFCKMAGRAAKFYPQQMLLVESKGRGGWWRESHGIGSARLWCVQLRVQNNSVDSSTGSSTAGSAFTLPSQQYLWPHQPLLGLLLLRYQLRELCGLEFCFRNPWIPFLQLSWNCREILTISNI